MNSSYETEPYKDKEIINFDIFSVVQNKFIEYPYTLKFNGLCKLLHSFPQLLFPMFGVVWGRPVCSL